MKRKLLTATLSFALAAVVGLAVVALTPGTSAAFSDWSGSQCATCHPAFSGFGDALHDLHTPMVNDCDTCHPSGGGSKPVATGSSGPITGGNGVGCVGCHDGAGLRLHHETSPTGPGAGTCITAGCHAAQTPDPEDTLPPYYATADVINVDDPCNTSGLQNMDENWDGNVVGLDNDGDNLYDGDDPDCQAAPPPPPPAGQATYDLKTGKLTSSETMVGAKAYSAELTRQPMPGFILGLTNAQKVTPTGNPTCTYMPASGVLECLDVAVTGLKATYHVILDHLGGFVFELRSATKN